MPEWFKGTVLKTVVSATVPRVRISPSPPIKNNDRFVAVVFYFEDNVYSFKIISRLNTVLNYSFNLKNLNRNNFCVFEIFSLNHLCTSLILFFWYTNFYDILTVKSTAIKILEGNVGRFLSLVIVVRSCSLPIASSVIIQGNGCSASCSSSCLTFLSVMCDKTSSLIFSMFGIYSLFLKSKLSILCKIIFSISTISQASPMLKFSSPVLLIDFW